MILVIFGVLLVVVLALVIVKVSSVIVGERQLLMSLCKFLVGRDGGWMAHTSEMQKSLQSLFTILSIYANIYIDFCKFLVGRDGGWL